MLLDVESTKVMLRISCSILQDTFFYDTASIERFLNIFGDVMINEITEFKKWADDVFLSELEANPQSKLFFTCYFVSINLRHIFVKHLFFNDTELEIFDSYINKITQE